MKFIYIFLLLIIGSLQSQAQATAAAVPLISSDASEIRLESFNKVWNTVNEKHYDPTFGGVNWNRVREIYAPKAKLAKSDAEFHAVLRRMLGELKLSHFGILPRAADLETAARNRGVTGIEIKMLDALPVIDRVELNSPAGNAGIRSGFILQAIDGKPIKEVTKSVQASLAGRSITEGLRKLYLERVIEAAVNGKTGTAVRLKILNANDRSQNFELRRAAFTGQMSQPIGNFPPQEVVFEARRLENNIGYVSFNMWIIPQMAKIRLAMREFADARGIIFDLRGNPGGIGGMAAGVAGLMVNKQGSLGTMKSRGGSLEFILYPQADPFGGTVAILTDHGSGSTSEVFAAGLQEMGRAKVIGTTSAGAVLPSVFEKLPTGAIFQYAISDYRSPRNILIEGRGVVPDIEVKQTRKALLAGRDSQLEAAIKYILN